MGEGDCMIRRLWLSVVLVVRREEAMLDSLLIIYFLSRCSFKAVYVSLTGREKNNTDRFLNQGWFSSLEMRLR